jgi:hypothetical protein
MKGTVSAGNYKISQKTKDSTPHTNFLTRTFRGKIL